MCLQTVIVVVNPFLPNTVSEFKVALEKIWESFPQNKVVRSLRKTLWEYWKAGEIHFEQLL